MKRLLIVGSGMTGASVSYLLSKSASSHLNMVMWDKSRGVGGRMSTARSNEVAGCQTDLGAQYFSWTPEYSESHRELYDFLIAEKVLEPLSTTIENEREYPSGTKHFVAPAGSSSIPKSLIAKAGIAVEHERSVASISLTADSRAWSVRCHDGSEEEVDALVLTMPVPQILALKGNFSDLLDGDTMTKLKQVEYSSRYALGLFFKKGSELPGEWTAQYVMDDPCLRFISKDHEKRGREDSPPALTVHTGVPFGLRRATTSRKAVQEEMMAKLTGFLPKLPAPEDSRLIYWRFSQVHKPYVSKPGCVTAHSAPPLILAGDAFSHSNINGAFVSATATVNALQSVL